MTDFRDIASKARATFETAITDKQKDFNEGIATLRTYVVPILECAKAGFADSGIGCVIEEHFNPIGVWPYLLLQCIKLPELSDRPPVILVRGLTVGFSCSDGKTVSVYVPQDETPCYAIENLGRVDADESETLVSKGIEY